MPPTENAPAFSQVSIRQVGFVHLLTAKPQLNLADVRGHFREHLAVGDDRAKGLKMTGNGWAREPRSWGWPGR